MKYEINDIWDSINDKLVKDLKIKIYEDKKQISWTKKLESNVKEKLD